MARRALPSGRHSRGTRQAFGATPREVMLIYCEIRDREVASIVAQGLEMWHAISGLPWTMEVAESCAKHLAGKFPYLKSSIGDMQHDALMSLSTVLCRRPDLYME